MASGPAARWCGKPAVRLVNVEPDFHGRTFERFFTGASIRVHMASLLPEKGTTAEKVSAIETALGTPVGRLLRAQVGKLIVEKFVPVEALVPPEYENSVGPPVRDAMLFVISHLSDARLAPELLGANRTSAGYPARDQIAAFNSKNSSASKSSAR